MSAVMPTEPLGAAFKVLETEAGTKVLELKSRITHVHATAAAAAGVGAGREKTRTKETTSGRIEETGLIGGEFTPTKNPQFLQDRKALFDQIVEDEKARIAGVWAADASPAHVAAIQCGISTPATCPCSQAA